MLYTNFAKPAPKNPVNWGSLQRIGPCTAVPGCNYRFNLLRLPLLILCLILAIGSSDAFAKTKSRMKILHQFTGKPDGAAPNSGVVKGNDGNYYGTTNYGGSTNEGTFYRVTKAGVTTVLHSFDRTSGGAFPVTEVLQASDGNFYGTTAHGGLQGNGVVYKITPNGSYSTLHDFSDGLDGGFPYSALVEGGDGLLYGTTYSGGSFDRGTIFRITKQGLLTTLHSFDPVSDGHFVLYGLSKGLGNTFYGTTQYGGTRRAGTVFSITESGVFQVLHEFPVGYGGANTAPVLASDGNLYGSTVRGTIYRLSLLGNYSEIYVMKRREGTEIYASLIESNDGKLYGVASDGGKGSNCGSYGCGTIFRISTDGVFEKLYNFTGISWFQSPRGALLSEGDGKFVGTTNCRCTSGGTVFSFRIIQSNLESSKEGLQNAASRTP